MSTTLERDTTQTQLQTTWNIDAAHTDVGFSVKHLMISTVRGRFGDVRGTITLNGADLTRASVEAEIATASIDTRTEQRDAHLRSADFFDVEKFPVLTFRSTQVGDVSGNGFKLHGDLTIHGVTRPVTLDVAYEGRTKDPWGGERVGYAATTRIKRSDFGLTWNQLLETGGLAVSDDVKITLDVQLVQKAA